MEKVILKSISDFVLQFGKEKNRFSYEEAYTAISGYANFLIQPLTLGMFVPAKLVDGVWTVLEEPKKRVLSYHDGISEDYHPMDLEEYQEAKGRILFEGFEIVRSLKAFIMVSNGIPIYFCSETKEMMFEKENYTIEDLFRRNNSLGCNLELTQTAQKQTGL